MTRPADVGEPGQSLYTGAAGIALLHIEKASRNTGSWDEAHRWLAAALADPVDAHPDACGLHRGAPAVAFALHTAALPSHRPALDLLDRHITDLTRRRLTTAHRRIDTGRLPALGEYDLISGLTGLGAYLLHRRADEHHGLLRDVLAYLVRLTEPVSTPRGAVPGWWTPNAPDDRPSDRWPHGHGNLSVAHGVSGPLAFLATAALSGVTADGQAEAMTRICRWLDDHTVGEESGGCPETVPPAAGETAGRPSWCYGIPGQARAQQLAGMALRDPARKHAAEHALARCLHDETRLRLLDQPGLCHGWAGLLLTAWRVARDADDPALFDLPRLLGRLDHHQAHHGPPRTAGLLDGAAGVELARRAVTDDDPGHISWDACLLLTGARPAPKGTMTTR